MEYKRYSEAFKLTADIRHYECDSYVAIAQELEVTPQAVDIQFKQSLEAYPHFNTCYRIRPGGRRRGSGSASAWREEGRWEVCRL